MTILDFYRVRAHRAHLALAAKLNLSGKPRRLPVGISQVYVVIVITKEIVCFCGSKSQSTLSLQSRTALRPTQQDSCISARTELGSAFLFASWRRKLPAFARWRLSIVILIHLPLAGSVDHGRTGRLSVEASSMPLI